MASSYSGLSVVPASSCFTSVAWTSVEAQQRELAGALPLTDDPVPRSVPGERDETLLDGQRRRHRSLRSPTSGADVSPLAAWTRAARLRNGSARTIGWRHTRLPA